MKIKSTLAVVLLAFTSLQSVRGQFTALAWNGSVATDSAVNIGAVTAVNVDAYPSMNYALLASKTRSTWFSDIGLLEVDLADASFTIGIDGFNPSHARFSWGFVNANGDFDFNFVPFPAGSLIEDEIYFQTVAQDPTAGPLNLSLSNFVGVKSQPLVPQVYSVSPRCTSQSGTISITGEYLDGTPSIGQTPIVTMGSETLIVTAFSRNSITAQIPLGAHSGSIRVHSDRGPSADLYYNVDHWVVVGGAYTNEGAPSADLLDGHMSVIGEIDSSTDVDDYVIHVEAGEELFVEIFNYDVSTFSVKPYNPAAWQSQQLNSEMRFSMPNVPISPLLYDNDGGPGFASAIGLGTATRFVAPFTGDYQISVSSAFQYSTGYYLLNTWTKVASTTQEPHLLGIHPNVMAVGGEMEIYGYGFDLTNPAGITVEFPGPNGTWLSATPYINNLGHLAVLLPMTARTGHLRIRNAANLVSTFDNDDYASFYLVGGSMAFEGPTYSFSGSLQVIGSMSVNQEVDNYAWTLNAGDKVTMRALPYDIINGRVLKGEYFDPATLDPEIHIGEVYSSAIYAIDIHSGPGVSAEIGGTIPTFIAPRSDVFDFNVRSWFYLSQGPYILDVVID